jgi:hypothetical protein
LLSVAKSRGMTMIEGLEFAAGRNERTQEAIGDA